MCLSCLHLVVVVPPTHRHTPCVRCTYHRSALDFLKPDLARPSQRSGAQTASPLGLTVHGLTLELRPPVWPKGFWVAMLGQCFTGSLQAISSYLCICQWTGTPQGLQTQWSDVQTRHRRVNVPADTNTHEEREDWKHKRLIHDTLNRSDKSLKWIFQQLVNLRRQCNDSAQTS